VTQPKAIVVKLERLVRTICGDRLFYIARRRTDFHRLRLTEHHYSSNGFAPTPAVRDLRSHTPITHRTSQKAELFCEICMKRPGCGCHRKTCDERLLLRAFPEIADTTGGRIAQKTNFSIAILLTESLHQFA
jgi:hypothetical protein